MIIINRFCCLLLLLSLLSACAVQSGGTTTKALAPISDPGELAVQLEQSFIAYKEGRLGDAEAMLHQILEEHPDLADGWFNLGNIYYRTGQYDAAVRAYEKTVTYDKGNGRAWYNLALTRIKQADIVLKVGVSQVKSDSPYYQRLGDFRKKLNTRLSSGEP